jgi:hypothetical protein
MRTTTLGIFAGITGAMDTQKMSPNRNSVVIMCTIDLLPLSMRLLVYEFGFKIVLAMIDDGYDDPVELRSLLETRRKRMQEAWLATDYVRPRNRMH